MTDPTNFCRETINIWRTVGYFLLIFKIVIPLILIILGMVDLGKAVISSDDKAISKAAKSLLMRIIAAICIFFIPTIVSFVINLVDGTLGANYEICANCISNPGGTSGEGACGTVYNQEFGS